MPKRRVVAKALPRAKRRPRIRDTTRATENVISGDLDLGEASHDTEDLVVADDATPSPSKKSKSTVLLRSELRKKKTSERVELLETEETPSTFLSSKRQSTRVKFTQKKKVPTAKLPSRQRRAAEEGINVNGEIADSRGAQESLEICQGFSKIKLEDWYPFFDHQYNKRAGQTTSPETDTLNPEPTKVGGDEEENEDDDEWEETLVYVDLKDIPHAQGLLASLTPATEDENGEGMSSGTAALSHIEMKIFNMESQLPVLLLGGKYLTGQWQDTVGTSLFFKKRSSNSDESPAPAESIFPTPATKLKSIVPEPGIPFDPLFGENYSNKDDSDQELVAKSFKILKAKLFPVVNEEQEREDFIRDNDDEFDHRDFQIPPIQMIRKFTTEKDLDFEKYLERDRERREKIHQRWAGSTKTQGANNNGVEPPVTVKTEPINLDVETIYPEGSDTFFVDEGNDDEPIPGPSHQS